MKKPFVISAALFFLCLMPNFAFGQTTRVQFARGATSATVTGRLKNYRSHAAYVIRVRRGQTLTVNQLKADNSFRLVTLSIADPNGGDASDSDASCGSRKRVENTVAGDYAVRVVQCQKVDRWRGNFRLKFTVK